MWIEAFWEERGAIIRHISAEEHDQVTPHVQGGVFLAVSLYAAMLRAAQADLRFVREVATPNSTLLTAMMGRMIRPTTLDVYLNLLLENEHNTKLAELMAEEAKNIASMLKSKDRDGLAKFIRGLSDFQPDDFKKWGMDMTNFIQISISERGDKK